MMKNILAIILIMFLSEYRTQAQELTANKQMENYLAKRNSFSHSSTKKFDDEEQKVLNDQLEDLKKTHPNSYQYNLISYINSGYSNEKKSDLFKAYEKAPQDKMVLKYLLAYYVINNDPKQKDFVKKIDDFYSQNQWNYYRDLIVTNKTDVIITSGQDDTYPLMATSMLYNIGSDIDIVCLDFLQNDTYRKRIQTMFGMVDTPFLGKEKYFISELLKRTKKKVVISSTVNQNYLTQVETTVFLTGLGYEYKCTDQRAALNKFWVSIQNKNLENITLKSWTERALYTNYIPPLLTLYRLKWLKNLEDPLLRKTIELLAIKVKKEKEVMGILSDYESD